MTSPAALLFDPSGVSSPPTVNEGSNTEVWFTDGDGMSVEGSKVPDYWVNKVGGEISSAIQLSGAALDMTNRQQLYGLMHGRLINVQEFLSAGNFTYTPTAGVKIIVVDAVGGGGGGGGSQAANASQSAAGSGGGSSAFATAKYLVSGPISLTVGAGGIGQFAANGTAGGNTVFGSLLTCPGGGYGLLGSAEVAGITSLGIGGAQPTGSGIITACSGYLGDNGFVISAAASASGKGAISPYGPGGGNTVSGNGNPGGGNGSGGGGGGSSPNAGPSTGGNGAPGCIIIYEFS